MTLQEKVGSLGLYLHVPFCATTCDFCTFYQEAPQRQQIDQYLDALETEMRTVGTDEPIETVFFGGGTPGLLMGRDFEKIFTALHKHFRFDPSEISVELAPSTVRGDKLKVLRDLGVTRVSMGVQSFDPQTLVALGRQQSPKLVYEAYDSLRSAGFDNINIDLMFAYPGQTPAVWEADMREALRLDPEHISTYCLTFEEDTALWVKLNEGKLRRDIGVETELYRQTWDFLPDNGYAQYEVSNFSKPGFECQHNISTWQMGQWIGLGPSAASQYAGWRWSNPADLKEWQEAIQKRATADGAFTEHAVDVTELSPELLATDAVIFGLRMNDGIDLDAIKKRWPEAVGVIEEIGEILCRFDNEGLLKRSANVYRCTDEGRLRVDAIGGELISCSA
ncbi:radical SAM family heme chaperone HemW [Rubellicoccus peritrichatus]|uniref:Heme chaperone HemW n=1 Tax=Rubellicoccus peritrichatus TaxID=3080537 RepID=A0AAQ3L916_9BACT|nr:radical SAM family heme chaperone HemW [Puniceicoccus sp. CR14]WOO41066.1 radical SAM family heme chaperone HemW [Puniceicoccus sp. CR14]